MPAPSIVTELNEGTLDSSISLSSLSLALTLAMLNVNDLASPAGV